MLQCVIVATMNTVTCISLVLQCCHLPFFCLPLCVTLWVGVGFRHLTAVRGSHLSLSAQDHPSHSFRQSFCFSNHSTCSLPVGASLYYTMNGLTDTMGLFSLLKLGIFLVLSGGSNLNWVWPICMVCDITNSLIANAVSAFTNVKCEYKT